jgi:hypothetical protein
MPQRDFDNYMKVFFHEMIMEGAVIIAPRPGEFGRFEKSFLDGVRKIPSAIDAPPGVNPYGYAMGRPGRWIFLWVPEK